MLINPIYKAIGMSVLELPIQVPLVFGATRGSIETKTLSVKDKKRQNMKGVNAIWVRYAFFCSVIILTHDA